MKKTGKSFIKLILLFLLIGGCIVLYMMHFKKESGLSVKEWDNIYNENNITFFYTDTDSVSTSKNLTALDKKYNITDQVSSLKGEKEKVLKTSDLVNAIVQYDDVPDSASINAKEIIEEKGSNMKVSGRDFAYIQRDFLVTAGINARVGEFRKEITKDKDKPSYYVVEYWSKENNKWVMFDCIDKGYYEKENKPLSSMEILEENLNDVTYIGNESQSDHKKKIKSYMYSYTIAIDNTLSMSNSNCYVTYNKNEKNINLKKGTIYIAPTIFTENKELFSKAPDTSVTEKDDDAYLILMYKASDNKNSINFVIGAFKNGAILDKSYVNINGKGYIEINKYTDMTLQEGENTIELSLDGVNTIKKIVLENNK